MSASPRTIRILAHLGLQPPSPIKPLEKPHAVQYASLPADGKASHASLVCGEEVNAACELLFQLRTTDPIQSPTSGLRRTFSISGLRERKAHIATGTFSKHELARAFNALIEEETLGSVGLAQVILRHASVSCIDELWQHFHNVKSAKKTSGPFRKADSSTCPPMTWLRDVVLKRDADYTQLLCQTGVHQSILNDALGTAISADSLDIMEVLLSYGACAAANPSVVHSRVKAGDLTVVRLLLSSPAAMTLDAWHYVLGPNLKHKSELLLLCVHTVPGLSTASLLLKALDAQDLHAIAIVLAYASLTFDFRNSCEAAGRLAFAIDEPTSRHAVFALLADAGLLHDDIPLRAELMRCVKERALDAIRILVLCGVSINIKTHDALHWVVERMDLEILRIFERGVFPQPVSSALALAPDGSSEAQMIELIAILEHQGFETAALSAQLVRAVRQQQPKLVGVLTTMGAQVDYREGESIHLAVAATRFDILGSLLDVPCSKELMAEVCTTAMELHPRSSRLAAMEALLNKGVLTSRLDCDLRTVVTETGDFDFELLDLLVKHGALANGHKNDEENVILSVIRRGTFGALKSLCTTKPSIQTLSEAVPLTYEQLGRFPKHEIRSTLQMLLELGAAGPMVDSTLLTAVIHDSHHDIVHLLLNHGADANYSHGAAYLAAIQSGASNVLETLCSYCIPAESSAMLMLRAVTTPDCFSEAALRACLQALKNPSTTLDKFWLSGDFCSNPNLASIVRILLEKGLDVNLANGSVVRCIIEAGETSLLQEVMCGDVSVAVLTEAFTSAVEVADREARLSCMNTILWKAPSHEIGQTTALVRQTALALAGDDEGLGLLLHHRAQVDVQGGVILEMAATAGSLEILDLLISFHPARSSLMRALFGVAKASFPDHHRGPLFDRILDAETGLLAHNMTMLLNHAALYNPDCAQLFEHLLKRGVRVGTTTLKIAMTTCSSDAFSVLLSHADSPQVATTIFDRVRTTAIDHERRLWLYQTLLEYGIPSRSRNEALLASLSDTSMKDLSCTKVLLKHGADVGYKNAVAFRSAAKAPSKTAFKLLAQFIKSDESASRAMSVATQMAYDDCKSQAEVYSRLLQWRIAQDCLTDALIAHMTATPDMAIIKMLLVKGADPNLADESLAGGHPVCFLTAVKLQNEDMFAAMSQYARPAPICEMLLAYLDTADKVLRWSKILLTNAPRSAATSLGTSILPACLARYPMATSLMRLYIDHGASMVNRASDSLCSDWETEACTWLTAALIQRPELSNEIIVLLIGRSKAQKGKSRPETLLQLDRDSILSQEIPTETVCHLGTHPLPCDLENLPISSTFSLETAALQLGNLEAFKLFHPHTSPDDGYLHLAALWALPRFVEHLLENHDPNQREEALGDATPLALACSAAPVPWSKTANAEDDFHTRQAKVMLLLSAKTDFGARFDHKSYLHLALENGVETTQAMVTVLGTKDFSALKGVWTYTDKAKRDYDTTEYVKEILRLEDGEQEEALLESLRNDVVCYARLPPPPSNPNPVRASESLQDLQLKSLFEERRIRFKALNAAAAEMPVDSLTLYRPRA